MMTPIFLCFSCCWEKHTPMRTAHGEEHVCCDIVSASIFLFFDDGTLQCPFLFFALLVNATYRQELFFGR